MIALAAARCHGAIAAIASRALPAARGEGDLATLLSSIHEAIAAETAASRPPDSPPPACGAGCASCCVVNVGTLALEGAAAAAYLRGRLTNRDRESVSDALLVFHRAVRWLEDRERMADGLACPLLDARGWCSIHPVRPLACRGMSSLDAADCRRAVADPEGEEALLQGDLLQKALHDEALDALSAALAERGLDARRRDVSGMVGCFLRDPDLAGAFLEGARIPLD